MKEFDEVRYNFYTAMRKIISFYKGYKEKKVDEYKTDVSCIDMYVAARVIIGDIDILFGTPIKTIGDLCCKGQTIMELRDIIELFEFWYCA